MSVAEVLREAGFCPHCPQPSPVHGDAETVVPQGVPTVPIVPTQKNKGESEDAEHSRARLLARQDSADRMAGRAPAHETAAILCRACGPVWASPAVAAVLPVVDGSPRALGCPWCIVRAEGKYVPRPPITSATCAHYQPDNVNPDGGMGRCKCGYHYPGQRHTCAEYQAGATA